MKINSELKRLLVRLKERVPAAKREQFTRNIRAHLESIEIDSLTGCVIAGSLVGAICEALPLDTLTGIDDWVEIGAALGGFVGYGRTAHQRKMRQQIEAVIQKELRHVLT